MKNFWKRAISFVLAVLMFCGSAPQIVSAMLLEKTEHIHEEIIGEEPEEILDSVSEETELPDFSGKKVSILGDSISTYTGISNNAKYNSTLNKNIGFYPANDVTEKEETWWQQVIDALGMELCVNNSSGGGRVLSDEKLSTVSNGNFTSALRNIAAYKDRCVNLHNTNGEKPDVIFVFMGTNDFSYCLNTEYCETCKRLAECEVCKGANSCENCITFSGLNPSFCTQGLGSSDINENLIEQNQDGTFTYNIPETTCEAYAIMLHKIKQEYPDAEIFCMGLLARRNPDYQGGYHDHGQPTEFNGEIRKIAESFGATFVDLENCGINKNADEFDSYIYDKAVHPNASGMDKITEAVISAMLREEVKVYDVSVNLTEANFDGKRVAVSGSEYKAWLTAKDDYTGLDVTVTMGGKDITESAYANGVVLIPYVTGDIVITVSGTGREPQNFRWEFDGTGLLSKGEDENVPEKLSGSISGEMFLNTRYKLERPIVLRHDFPWILEWEGEGTGGFMLAEGTETNDGNKYFFHRSNNTLEAFGYWNTEQSMNNNYGVSLKDIIDTGKHKYRAENRISSDGNNMVYLTVDGEKEYRLDNLFHGGNDQNVKGDWINGKDFVFNYIGTNELPLTNYRIDYLSVWEDGKPSLEGKTFSILGASISTYAGTSNGAAADTTNSTIRNNAKYYPHSVVKDVTLNDTWWMQAANDLGLRLLVNNSWSGSTLLHERSGTVGAYVDRCVQLHDDTGENAGETPDIIGIQMGSNDFQYYKETLGTADIDYSVLIKENGDGTFTYAEPETSLEAAAIVLHKISVRYPNAEVYYLNISQRIDGTDAKFFNTELGKVVEYFGANIVDIYGSVITPETFDTHIGDGRVHPNKFGMDAYTEAFKRAVLANTSYEAETHLVSFELERVSADYGDDKIVISGDSFDVNLSSSGDVLEVSVTMGGKDITETAYKNGKVSIESVTGDVIIKARSVHEPKDYRFEFNGTDLVCVSGDNALEKISGTTTDGFFNKTAYSLEKSVILMHDYPWTVEWKSEGTFMNENGSTGARIFTSDNINTNYNARYIFKSAKQWLIAMGEKDENGSHNYGIALENHGIDGSAPHIYRLENRISEDGSNMIWLFVDGKEIGPMNNYYVGTTDKNTTSDWLSGKDFAFPYMGTDTHGFSNAKIDYIAVWEGGKPSFEGKKVSILGDSISTYTGISNNTDYNSTIGNNAVYYSEGRHGVYRKDTWWQQAIDTLGMELCVNNSWSGSCVFSTRSGTVGAYVDRAVQLHNDKTGEEPDIIAVYLGTNDAGVFGSTLGKASDINYDELIKKDENGFVYEEPATAAEAYAIMIHKIINRYPNSEVYCFTLLNTDKFNSSIRSIAEHFGVNIVDIYKQSGITAKKEIYMDGAHPKPFGMDAITGTFISSLYKNSTYAKTEIYDVSYELSGIIVQQGTAYAAAAGEPFGLRLLPIDEAEIGKVSVTMGGKDVTAEVYGDAVVSVPEVTGDIVIKAVAKPDFEEHLQTLPEKVCSMLNIWSVLEHEDVYYYNGTHWGKHNDVHSVTFPVNPGERIFATSFKKGARVTFFGEDEVIESVESTDIKDIFAKDGFVIVPEGTVAVNIPMYDNSDENEIYLLNREHEYKGTSCSICGTEHPNAANYEGKVISVLGDSISTFAGYIPVADGFNLEHLARYPQDNLLTDVNETWWMQIISEFDAKLGINDSWRGSTVSGYPSVTTGVAGYLAAMSNPTQIQNLGSNGTPDVILFYGGTNDLAHTPKLGEFDPETAPKEAQFETLKWDNLADGYCNAILRLRYFYPDAEIIAMFPTFTKTYYTNDKLAQGNALLAEICEHYGIKYVDLRYCGISVSDLPDGIHPDAKGMDYITDAVIEILLEECETEAGENTVYTVKHDLDGAKASKSYYKGVSAGKIFEETLEGENLSVKVTMGGKDITAECYKDGKVLIQYVTGEIVVTATGEKEPVYAGYIQELPEDYYGKNLWKILEHNEEYYTVSGWGKHSSGKVRSVTFKVEAGEKIFASSFGKAGVNGTTGTNGIRITFFNESDVLVSMSADAVYAEFSEKGYITVPENAKAVNVPMWTDYAEWELYVYDSSYEPEFSLGEHLQTLPEKFCAGTNLWKVLKPENIYYTASGWGIDATGLVHSVTVPIEESDKLWATSFAEKGKNGNNTYDGIRVTFFGEKGVVVSLTHTEVFEQFTKNGFVTAPEGAVAVNIPMWNNSDENELYILNREHDYESVITEPTCTEQGYTTHTCSICGDSYVDSYVEATGHTFKNGVCTICEFESSTTLVITEFVNGTYSGNSVTFYPNNRLRHIPISVKAGDQCSFSLPDGWSGYICLAYRDQNWDYTPKAWVQEYSYTFPSDMDAFVVMRKDDNSVISPEEYTGEIIFTRNKVDPDRDVYFRDYYQEEIDKTIESVKALIADEPCLVFPMVSDIHYLVAAKVPYSFDYSIANLHELSGEINFDFIACLGDITEGDATQEITSARTTHIINRFARLGVPYYQVIGNHDDNRYGDATFTHEQLYENYLSTIEDVVFDTSSMYKTNYYKDFDDLKIRCVFLNANENGAYGYSEETCDWFEEAIKTENSIIVFTHITPIPEQNYGARYGTDRGSTRIREICANADNFLIMFSGHNHYDLAITEPFLSFTMNCQKFENENGDPDLWAEGAVKPQRVAGTASEDCFDIVVVRPESGRIDLVRFGAGEDRSFLIESKHTHTYETTVTAPTCTEQGYTTHTCSVCGDSYVDSYVEPKGHSFSENKCELCGIERIRVYAEDIVRYQGGVDAETGILNTTFTNNWYSDIYIPEGAEKVSFLTFKTGGNWGSAFMDGNSFISGYADKTTGGQWVTIDVPEKADVFRYGYLYDSIADKNGYPRFEYVEFLGQNMEPVPESEYMKRPATGCHSFSVKVNIASALGEEGYVEGTDYGYIMLPTSYRSFGEATRLIIVCHGASAKLSNYQSDEWKENNYSFWTELGYAVMDMYACPKELSGDGSELHYGNPSVLECYKAGYDYVMKNFNLKKDGIFVIGASMGGLSSFQLVQSEEFPVIAQVGYCPVTDMFKQAYCNPWTTASYQRSRIAQYFGFEGTKPQFTNGKFPSAAEIGYFRENIEKVVEYSPLYKGVVSGNVDVIFGVTPNFAVGFSEAEEELYGKLTATHPCPVMIFHNLDDSAVSYRYSEYFKEMVERSGQEVILHTFETGGHNAWDNGSSVSVQGINKTLNLSVSKYKAYEFFKGIEDHSEHYSWVDPAVAPTCTETGLTEGSHCAYCGEILVKQNVVQALGHTEAIDEAVAPTCTETGLTEGKHCSVCGEILVAQEIVPATGHNYESVVTEPTCTEQGYTTHTCSVCGDSYVDSYVEAKGHTFGEWYTVTEASCSEAGEERRDCKNCEHYETKEVPALGHDEIAHAAKEATCTEIGWDEYVTCSRCDYTTYVEIPELGHNEVTDAAKAPTCTETGLTEGKHCSVCNTILVKQNVVPALGHTEVMDKAVAPTCTETGLTEGKHCSVCGEVLVAQEIVPATGHNYESVITDPTCTEQGFTTHTCSVCGESYIDSYVEPKGHSFGEWYTVAEASCSEAGEERRDCENCDYYETQEIPPKGYEIGDINLDGKVDVMDAYYIRLVVAKLRKPTEQQILLGDVDGDGKITAIDANIIRKFAVKIISSIPVAQ